VGRLAAVGLLLRVGGVSGSVTGFHQRDSFYVCRHFGAIYKSYRHTLWIANAFFFCFRICLI